MHQIYTILLCCLWLNGYCLYVYKYRTKLLELIFIKIISVSYSAVNLILNPRTMSAFLKLYYLRICISTRTLTCSAVYGKKIAWWYWNICLYIYKLQLNCKFRIILSLKPVLINKFNSYNYEFTQFGDMKGKLFASIYLFIFEITLFIFSSNAKSIDCSLSHWIVKLIKSKV